MLWNHDVATFQHSVILCIFAYYIILNDRKNFQFEKRGIGIESEKYVCKQVRDQKSMETN